MKQDIAVQWVAALRSGDYKQGTGRLRNAAGGFCCLGVLCDVHAKTTLAPEQQGWNHGDHYLGCRGTLPAEVVGWSGIESTSGIFSPNDITTTGNFKCDLAASLTGANDSGVPFEVIANFIEKNYKHL